MKNQKRIEFISKNRLSTKDKNLYAEGKNLYYSILNVKIHDFCFATKIPIKDIILTYFNKGIVIDGNYELSEAEFLDLCSKYNFNLIENKNINPFNIFTKFKLDIPSTFFIKRPPVVTILGHVDHGKTTLLDTIRKTNVAEKESGLITQKIAGHLYTHNGDSITFIDTPGHKAFDEMRSRGARVTDLILLVVSAKEGIKEQTLESIKHIKLFNAKYIVVFTKIDLEDANVSKCIDQFKEHDIYLDNDQNDKIKYIEVSAKKNINIDKLLDLIISETDKLKLKTANNYYAHGSLIEKHYSKKMGNCAYLLIKFGTLVSGDVIIIGNEYVKIKFMKNELGNVINKAVASDIVEIFSIQNDINLGDIFIALNDLKVAKYISDIRQKNKKIIEGVYKKNIEFKSKKNQKLKIILCCDTSGSEEAIIKSIKNIVVENVNIEIVKSFVGTINNNTIKLAQTTNSSIYLFNLPASKQIIDEARYDNVMLYEFNVIYDLLDNLEEKVISLSDSTHGYKYVGGAKVIKVFDVPNIGVVAGCLVIDGKITSKSYIKVLRNNKQIHLEKIKSLKNRTNDVDVARKGIQCGIKLINFKDYQINDEIKAFVDE